MCIRDRSLILEEAIVAADIAIDRKTPVAFTNVLPAQIQEELAGRDLPLILNSTPGVYATQQGGGDGDARVTIRGFDQTNLAVMVDGKTPTASTSRPRCGTSSPSRPTSG